MGRSGVLNLTVMGIMAVLFGCRNDNGSTEYCENPGVSYCDPGKNAFRECRSYTDNIIGSDKNVLETEQCYFPQECAMLDNTHAACRDTPPVACASRRIPFGPFDGKLLVQDLNSDSIVDLIYDFRGLHVARGTAGGIFEMPVSGVETQPGRNVGFVLRDFDGDGQSDVAIANELKEIVTLRVYWRTGPLSFELDTSTFAFEVASLWGWIAAGDLNRNGKPDIVLQRFGGVVVIEPERGSIAPRAVSSDLLIAEAPGVADLFNEGAQRLISYRMTSNGRELVSAAIVGDPPKLDWQPVPFAKGVAQEASFECPPSDFSNATDLNGDGLNDVYCRTGRVLFGGVSKRIEKIEPTREVWRNGGKQAFLADLNGDSRLDVVALSEGTNDIPTTQIVILLGDGKGGFGAPESRPLAIQPKDLSPGPMAVADVDGDGVPEILVAGDDARNANPAMGQIVVAEHSCWAP